MTETLEKYFDLCSEIDKAIQEEENIDLYPPFLARTFLKRHGIYHKIFKNHICATTNEMILYQKLMEYTIEKLK